MSCSSFRKVSTRSLVELLLRAAIWASTVSGAPECEVSPIVHVLDLLAWIVAGIRRSDSLEGLAHKVKRPKFLIVELEMIRAGDAKARPSASS